MLDPKKQHHLYITLTEPIAFLRTPDPSGRLQPDPDDPPTIVRGVLTLNVAKPIEISSIEAELSGMLAISYQEGIGSRSIELPEKQKIYASTVTVFRADQAAHGRRSASVEPGLSATNSTNEDEHAATTLPRPPSLPRGRTERRSVVSVPPQLGPTPPYTLLAQSPTPIQAKLGEHPAQTLEDLRQALRENLEGQVPPSSRSHSIAFPLPNLTIHSTPSSTSNDSLHRENDNHIDNVVHPNPPLEGDSSFRNPTEEHPHVPPHSGPSPTRPSRAHSLENSRETQPSTPGNGRDSSNPPSSRSRLRLSLAPVLDAVREVTSRTSSRSRSVARSEERGRGRTRIRIIPEEQERASILELGEGVTGTGNGSQLGANESHPSGLAEHREHHLLGLGRILGLERDHEIQKDGEQKHREHAESCMEFKPGTYNYPISFVLPPHLPPTFSVPNGSLSYAVKGVAHRPGTFTSKLACQASLLVVSAPAIGTGEGGVAGDSGPLSIQKQWRDKLAYSFGLSSTLFLLGSERHLEVAASESVRANTESLGQTAADARAEAAYGTATLDLTFLPLEKVKIWRLDVIVDQRIRYLDERGRHYRDDDKKHVRLLAVHDEAEEMDLEEEEQQTHKNKHKHKHKHESTRIPLLPTPISPHRSPLVRYLPPSADPSILIGPGPYTLSTNIGLPGCNDPSGGDRGLHFTMKQKSSSVKVEHSLRLVIRVECVGDEGTNDHEEKKGKLFDITLQTPITLLSCRCVPESQTLPRYSQITEDNSRDRGTCPCQPSITGCTEDGNGHDVGDHLRRVMTPSSTSSFEIDSRAADEQRSGPESSRSPSQARRNGHASSSLRPHPPSPAGRGREREAGPHRSPSHTRTLSHGQQQHSQSYTVSTSHVRALSQTPPSRPPSPLARYERLVSGLESEAGEAPPSYESIASGSSS
ncbi:hypothetical protein HD554DRAFT_1619258 [Boletus coccyginus]|nr:hypothetical protein HD554DRAFT_1619258 [Boletus coccyginus]